MGAHDCFDLSRGTGSHSTHRRAFAVNMVESRAIGRDARGLSESRGIQRAVDDVLATGPGKDLNRLRSRLMRPQLMRAMTSARLSNVYSKSFTLGIEL